MPDQSRLAKRTPRTLDTYVQAAIDTNTSSTPSAVKRPRRRRKKRQEETSNPLPLYQQTAVTQTAPPAPAKIKRRKRKTKLKNAILQDGKTLQRCKFLVRGLVTAEDLEDEDEAEEVEAEVRADFERFGLKEIVIVKKAKTGFLVGDVTATFQDAATAALAFDAFNNKVFGGKMVTCVWKMRSDEDNVAVVINGMLTPEELEDPDEVADVEEEMMQIFTKYGEVTELWLNEIDGEVTERAYAQNKAVKRSRRLVLGMHETWMDAKL
ncbi:uncharacterized protein PITG_06931 [Phytophthora infestans T30-4]|uniref:RRM domain-containing protein n=1 Tax=Phytophthora infestans (strain T30-4) TaxID=403677 RepID=D0N6U1_PHYIT|nr:uncharacterized protein PITG_06931 [Phytophthora infestans T30-4]EEY53290.1 hypothetical protein PITG_06931 [Phytophthora infestans T30-4]|eukprot:XP_002904908.1 hypothetical protein PITG_06931 [Phytophthora infestans T30-4]